MQPEPPQAALDEQASNPFPGLRPFGEGDEHLFFGRDDEIDLMLRALEPGTLLTLVGPPGCGKTSLVTCGLLHALRQGALPEADDNWRMAVVRPGGQPLRNLARALDEAGAGANPSEPLPAGVTTADRIETALRHSRTGLAEALQDWQPPQGGWLLLVVDAVEDLFRTRTPAASAAPAAAEASDETPAFVDLLLEASRATGLRVRIALTLQSAFLDMCAQYPALTAAMNQGVVLVSRLSRQGWRDAVERPAAVMGGSVAPSLVNHLLNGVADSSDAFVLLQHALGRAWAYASLRDQTPLLLTLSDYEAIGTVSSAMDLHCEQTWGELDDRGRQVCEAVFKVLVSHHDARAPARRRLSVEQVCAMTGHVEADVISTLAPFRQPTRAFVVPLLPAALEAGTLVELSNDGLLRLWTRLREWISEDAASLVQLRRLQAMAELNLSGQVELLRDLDLDTAAKAMARTPLTDAWAGSYGIDLNSLIRYQQESDKARQQGRQRQQRQRWAAGAALLVLFGLTVWLVARWVP